MGKLIVLEGTDGSGKSTQSALLAQRLQREGISFQKIVFPQYGKPSAAMIEAYLHGEFGTDPGDVNAFAASTFYAVDRFASYRTVWKDYYEAGGLMLADRWTTSNAVHQGAKLEGEERTAFFDWLDEFEYGKMGLPRPDLVLYLDMPTEMTEQLMRKRERDTNTRADIHEQDNDYLRRCRACAREAAERFGWSRIPCVEHGRLRTIEEIHEELYGRVMACLEERQ